MKIRMHRHAVVQPLDTSYRLIPLTKGQNAIVDAEDFAWLSQWNWSANPNRQKGFYATSIINGKKRPKVYMHRFILDAPPEMEVDHKSGNTLDNRKENLRLCTRAQNASNMGLRSSNTSGYKGVFWSKQHGQWQGRIRVNYKWKHLGFFDTPLEAASAYNEAARIHHGDFAAINIIE